MGPNHSQDQCVQCDFEFKTWEEHRSHVEVAHSNIWKFKCGFCPEIFDSLEDAKSHKKSEHPSEVKVRKRPKAMTCCYVCGKEMQTTHLQVMVALVFSLFKRVIILLKPDMAGSNYVSHRR